MEPTLRESDSGRTVPVGTRFSIELEENPTTGYTWSQPQLEGGSLTLESDETIPFPGAGIGGGGVRRFAFSAKSSGRTTIRLVYRRSWEGDASAAARYEITVVATR
jgi:inhibitor of cysteine peptidase